MIRTYLSIFALVVLLAAGCTRPEPDGTSHSSYGNSLFEKADTLAAKELLRFNAIDMTYRNLPELHKFQSPATSFTESGWIKIYRRFSSYTVVDVKQSDSLMKPIIYEINYHYDVYATSFRNTRLENALQLTENDARYTKQYTATIERQYYCDEDGIPIDTLRKALSRPLYFEHDFLKETIDAL